MHPAFALLFSALNAGSLFMAAFLLLTRVVQANRDANKWLGAFFLLLSLLFIELLLEHTGNPQTFLIIITEWPRWAIFPCLYIAVFTFVYPQQRPPLLLIHFLPAFLFILSSLIVNWIRIPSWIGLMVHYFFFAQGLVYGLLNIQILTKHQNHIRQILADTASDLTWLRNFVYAPLVIAGVWLAFRQLPAMDSLLQLLCLTVILYIVSAAFRQRDVYPKRILDAPDRLMDAPPAATTPQRLTPQQIDILKERVEQVITQYKPYLDPAVNLQNLADRVGITTHELSLVLNQGFKLNFYAYINNLRAEEAMKLLQSGQYGRGDMEAIAYRSGFNSRTTFYTTIKKFKGKTPTSLLKKNVSR